MKFKIALLTLLCSVAITPAHAISAHYRAQLERSGCTQVTDGHGCDIHKTKEQNKNAISSQEARLALEAEAYRVVDKPISDGAEYLLSKDWKPDNGVWKKQGYTLTLKIKDNNVIDFNLIK